MRPNGTVLILSVRYAKDEKSAQPHVKKSTRIQAEECQLSPRAVPKVCMPKKSWRGVDNVLKNHGFSEVSFNRLEGR